MSAIGERFLAHHLAFRPVDGTFMGRSDCDGLLPRADAQAAADEWRAIEALEAAVKAAPESTAAERMDKRLAAAELTLAAANLRERPRFANPAWYSGEAAFGIIGLLLPQSAPQGGGRSPPAAPGAAALRARLEALPDFLADGRARLRDSGAAPKGWSERAAREASALAQFLQRDLPQGDLLQRDLALRATQALQDFARAVEGLEDRNPAAGREHLEMVMRDVHGIAGGAESLLGTATTLRG
jgi:hypothetical protein